MRDYTLSHPLDLAAGDDVHDLFAEEISPAEQLQMCCDNCASTFSTVACTSSASTFSSTACLSCECS